MSSNKNKQQNPHPHCNPPGARHGARHAARSKSSAKTATIAAGGHGERFISNESTAAPEGTNALIVSMVVVVPLTVGVDGFTVHPMLPDEGAQDTESGMLKPPIAFNTTGALPDRPEGITTREAPSESENALRFTFRVTGALVEGL